MTHHHRVLGVSENASAAEVKAAFRKLAHRYHPDISREQNAKEKFIEVVAAYRALTDGETPAANDSAIVTPAAQEYSPNASYEPQADTASDCHIDAYVSVEELYWGTELKINPSTACLGRRSEKNWRNSGLLKVKIPRGTRAGERLRISAKKRNAKSGETTGDIYITVKLKTQERYNISGDDLYIDMPLSRLEAAHGAIIDLITPGGRIEVDVPAGIASGQSIRIPRRGLPVTGSEHGDLFAVARVMNIDARSRKLHKWPHVPHADASRWRTTGGRHGNTIDVHV